MGLVLELNFKEINCKYRNVQNVIQRGFQQTTTGKCTIYPFLVNVDDAILRRHHRTTLLFQFGLFISDNTLISLHDKYTNTKDK